MNRCGLRTSYSKHRSPFLQTPPSITQAFEGSFSFLNSLHFTYSLVSALCIAHCSITFFVSFPTNAITKAKCVAKWLAVRGSASFFIKSTEMIRSWQFYIFTYFRCTQAHTLMLMRSTILMPSVPQCNACSMPDRVLGTSLPRVKKKAVEIWTKISVASNFTQHAKLAIFQRYNLYKSDILAVATGYEHVICSQLNEVPEVSGLHQSTHLCSHVCSK